MTTVIYHSADYDGIFCREIARKFLPDAELIGWNFGDPPVRPTATDKEVYVLDLPVDKPFGIEPDRIWPGCSNVIWIDHHKSAIESHPKQIPGYRIDGVSACRLAWQWLSQPGSKDVPLNWKARTMPCKQDFVDRTVKEPLAVRLTGEYDIWDKRDPRADTFQYALRSLDISPTQWDGILSTNPCAEDCVEYWLKAGGAAQKYQARIDADVAKHRSFDLKWEGLNFMTINAVRCNSLTFEAAVRNDHDALLGFYWNGKVWTVSLYHAPHRKDIDLSLIAVKYGGGGHKGACGFTCKTLPFTLC